MYNQELRLKKKVQLIVAGAMTLFFVLVTVLAFTTAILINKQKQERNLKNQITTMNRQIENLKKDEAYYNSQKFIEYYALKVLGWGKNGQKVFE